MVDISIIKKTTCACT